MFFAEVRPLRGDLPPGRAAAGRLGRERGPGATAGNAQQAAQLAELQKQIINGTWKLIRRETRPKPSDDFVEDAKILRESQKAVLDQAAQLGERLHDPASKASLEQAPKP